ncbi:OprD family outer membrane porin [Acinetobacter brisouii]|uniref:OprD family outer membrane porin n=1 Tax=Acinetobacter brisouii TaxID=396323 RepID=UPI0005F7861B|nr:OprD family outer membrane porin [Acinetobacter brisouii]KJV39832.1 membrane protein [Acinetobacter brisouii]
MLKAQKLTLAVLIQATLLSPAFASEQSESKGFVEDAKASILFRNGFISRNRTEGRTDLESWGQAAIGKFDSGFTQGIVGVGVGAVGDVAFKIGANKDSGNQMLHLNGKDDVWARGGANIKARISNTTVRYGTQFLELPVLSSNDARLLPEYYTGTLVTSHEIKNLELTYGQFTKDQYSNQVNTDGNHLKRADVWGAQYKFTDNLKASYFGSDLKDSLERHYADVNYKYPIAADSSLTFDLSGYHTKYDSQIYNSLSFPTGDANTSKTNNIWAFSTTYNKGNHTGMLAYQQSSGNVGYDYNIAADGGGTIWLPNSYLSDFNGNGEKSLQAQYSYNFAGLGIPGLTWTTAYVYGWNIHVDGVTSGAKEHEFFNQVKYTVQSGFAKNLSFKVRNSTYHSSYDYSAPNGDFGKGYLGTTNEWRVYVEYPLNLF